jgi:predicted naringenin-chalcone synthase
MLLPMAAILAGLLAPSLAAADERQVPLTGSDVERLHIAIVGAGAGVSGASAAFSLHNLSSPSRPMSVTIFEQMPAYMYRLATGKI